MPIKMIVTDIDGTILDDPNADTMDEAVVSAFREAMARGVSVCLASGRNYSMMLPVEKKLGISGLSICCNGAVIRDKGEIIRESLLDWETVKQCRQFAEKYRLSIGYYVREELYMENFCPDSISDSEKSGEVDSVKLEMIHGLEELEQCSSGRINKIIFTGGEESVSVAFEAWPCENADILIRTEYSRSYDNVFGITPKGADKGSAMAFAARRTGVKPEEILAIGDNENDIPMIKSAGIGVAVKNAARKLLEAADVVVPSVKENGAAYAVREYVLK